MDKFLLFGFLTTSVVLTYTTYKLRALLEAEKRVTVGLKSALAALVENKQKKTTRSKK
jgi:hypothetical protein